MSVLLYTLKVVIKKSIRHNSSNISKRFMFVTPNRTAIITRHSCFHGGGRLTLKTPDH